MKITLIAAVAANRIIGAEGAMPWKIPGEQKGFRAATMGHPMIMGRTTFEQVGALPGRRSIVMSRDGNFDAPDVEVARSVEQALALVASENVFVVGGAQIYAAFLPIAERMLLSLVDGEYVGDTSFPGWPFDSHREWLLIDSEQNERWIVLDYVRICSSSTRD